ncbi:MAG: metalloregulator ArsR/SmtB family transcription factor [Aestuariivirga sp.]|jgi:DNA-binding transcriptional ArsR family regulator
MLNDRIMQTPELATIFGSLGQSTRLEIIKLLAPLSKPNRGGGLPAGQIAKALNTAPATLSFHLKDMALRNLLAQRRMGREIYYQANLPLVLAALDSLVTDLEK